MATITGSGGPESLDGDGAADVILGLGGDDTLGGGQGDDSIEGGDGNDRLVDGLSFSADTASDVDRMFGGAGNDTLISNQGNHFQDNDSLFGGSGDDFLILNGVQTGDSVGGGDGIDTADIRLTTTFQTVFAVFNQAGFVVQLNGVNTVFLSTVERIFLNSGTGNDSIVGGALDDSFSSTGGSDTIDGRGGDDVIEMDYYGGGGSALNLNGGIGADVLSWTANRFETAALSFNMTTGVFLRDSVSYGSIINFERLFMSGGGGGDTLVGAALGDIFNAGGGNDSLRGEDGDDLLRGDEGADTIFGGNGNDRLEGDLDGFFGSVQSSNELYGGAGNDTLSGGSLVDTLNGGQGDDLYLVNGADVIIDTGGIDEIQTERTTLDMTQYGTVEDAYMVNGGTVTGNARDNAIINGSFVGMLASGGGGDDSITGAEGFDNLSGDAGNDQLWGDAGSDQLAGGAGKDTVSGGAGFDNILGDAGNDLLSGGDSGDALYGGLGNDELRGESLPVNPGVGSGSGSVVKALDQGTFSAPLDLTGAFALTPSPDIINPTAAPHVSVSATVNPSGDYFQITLTEAGVPLTVDVDRGALAGVLETEITLYDPNGNQVARNSGASPTLGAGGSTSSDDAYLTYTTLLPGTYTIRIADISFFGATSDQYVVHVSLGEEGGNDFLDGGEGDDTLFGGYLDDTLLGGAGDDVLSGGTGTDTASYAGATAGVTVSLAASGAQNTGGAGIDRLSGVENLIGSDFNDRLTGTNGQNVLDGGLGNDTINGGGGRDQVSYAVATAGVTVSLRAAGAQDTGGAGSDRLSGIEDLTGSGFDDVLTGSGRANSILGGNGNDVIDGGGGNDSLYGGGNVDTLSYASAAAGVAVNLSVIVAQDTGGAGTDLAEGFENLTGSAFGDTLTGNALANVLIGGAGGDLLDGGLGRDVLQFVGAADVRVNLATGTATGAGADTLAGFEDVVTDAGNDSLTGDALNNLLVSGGGQDTVDGGGGDDTVDGGPGNDSLDGGTGIDRLSYELATSAVTVSLALAGVQATGGGGNDRIAGFEVLVGSAFGDTLAGSATADNLIGGAGNDSLTGGAGNDTLAGDAGDDTLNGGSDSDVASYAGLAAAVTVDLNIVGDQDTRAGGIDRLISIEGVIGTVFNDALTGTAGANLLSGGVGFDVLIAGDGNDTVLGGAGSFSDTLDGGGGIDTVSFADAFGSITVDLAITVLQSTGSTGGDLITGFEHAIGGQFADALKGDATANRLDGGLGNDTLEGRDGNDTLTGGDGVDVASYASAGTAVRVDLAITTAQATGGAGSDTLVEVEGLLGSAFADTLLGGAGDDSLDGNGGNDSLDGRAGNDTLSNSLGDDTLNGGTGSDTVLLSISANLALDLTLAGGQNTGAMGIDTLVSIENLLVTGSGSASLTGNTADNLLSVLAFGNDTLNGGGGNDTLKAGSGTNVLIGGAGLDSVSYLDAGLFGAVVVDLSLAGPQLVSFGTTDTFTDIEGVIGTSLNDALTGSVVANRLTGNAGNDTLNGGAGADTLSGGLGLDTLTGGAGADVFLFDTAPDAASLDVVEDMAVGVDDIGLSALVFAALGPTVTAIELRIGAAATTAAHRLIYDSATGALSWDADGSGAAAAVQFATLDTGLALTAGDFVIV